MLWFRGSSPASTAASIAASIAAAVFFFHFLISVFVAFGSASAGSKVGSAGKQRKGEGSPSILAVATFSTREPHPHPHRHPSREQARIHVSTFARIVAKNNMSRTNFRRKRHWPICFTHSLRLWLSCCCCCSCCLARMLKPSQQQQQRQQTRKRRAAKIERRALNSPLAKCALSLSLSLSCIVATSGGGTKSLPGHPLSLGSPACPLRTAARGWLRQIPKSQRRVSCPVRPASCCDDLIPSACVFDTQII